MATNVTYPQAVTVGTSAVQITFTGTAIQNAVLLLQRNGDAGNVYVGADSGVTTSTGTLVAKGVSGQTAPTPLPANLFRPGGVYSGGFWLVSGSSSQTVDVTPG